MGRPLDILVNGPHQNEEYKAAAWNTIPNGLAIKGSAWVRGHHLNGERSWILEFQR